MKVGFLTVDWSATVVDDSGLPALGGSGHIRIAQYLPHLGIDYVIGAPAFHTKKGIFGCLKVDTMDRLENGDLDVNSPAREEDVDFDCDVIYTQRNMHTDSDRQIARARSAGQVVINDVDDWYWGLDHRNRAFKATDPKNNPVYNIDGYRRALELSSAVVVSTPYLRDRIREWNPRTYVLENHVETQKFTPYRHGHGETAKVGWVGATGFRSGDLDVLRPMSSMFPWVHGGHANWMPSFGELLGIADDDYERMPLTTAADYPNMFQFDIGTVPLNDVPFNRGKSWIKGLEYASAGIPFIASKMPAYLQLQKEYGLGYIAKNTHGWVKTIKKLSDDPVMRQDLADEGVEKVQQLDVVKGAVKLQDFLEAAGASK